MSAAAPVDPASRDAWHRTRGASQVIAPSAVALPLAREASVRAPAVVAASPSRVATGDGEPLGPSLYCPPAAVASASATPRRLSDEAPAFAGLSPWGLLVLARLAPLLTHLEEAATAYDLPAQLLLQVLLHESFLDPLARGPTDDVGLSQVTADALALVRSISSDPASAFRNAMLATGPIAVYDPDFSICAGAAKLAWARAQTGGSNDAIAYARFVNPLDGVVHGRVSARHEPIVAAFERSRPMAAAMAAVVAAHRERPGSLAPAAAALLAVADDVAGGDVDVEAAYRRSAELVERYGIADAPFYAAVLRGLYGDASEAGGVATLESASLVGVAE